RGYLNRPELTRGGFVPDPFRAEPGQMMYRTGDVCRWLADGRIDCLGRADGQVKVRGGHRVEVGEVEAVLQEHPAVRQACVLAQTDAAENVRLHAYIAADPPLGDGDAKRARALDEHVEVWRRLYEDLYQRPERPADPTFHAV